VGTRARRGIWTTAADSHGRPVRCHDIRSTQAARRNIFDKRVASRCTLGVWPCMSRSQRRPWLCFGDSLGSLGEQVLTSHPSHHGVGFMRNARNGMGTSIRTLFCSAGNFGDGALCVTLVFSSVVGLHRLQACTPSSKCTVVERLVEEQLRIDPGSSSLPPLADFYITSPVHAVISLFCADSRLSTPSPFLTLYPRLESSAFSSAGYLLTSNLAFRTVQSSISA
jgi:hypothetical protein